MQSRVPEHHEFHQRLLTAARLTNSEADRQAFLSGLLEDSELCQAARRSFLKQLVIQGISGPLLEQAAQDSLCTVLRTAFRRLDTLLLWDAQRGSLATWWGQQAMFEFNNDGRRQAERTCGIWRSTGETYRLDALTWISAEGELMETECCDEQSDPAERHERRIAGSFLEQLLRAGQDTQAATWLREWTAADALHPDQPLHVVDGAAQLTWRYGAQREVAAQTGVTARTLRTRTRRVERLLSDIIRTARA